MDNKIKRFIECYIPVTTCNLRCHYCYITQQRKFSDALPKFTHTAEFIAKALSPERLGGICMLNMCGGGETLLPPEMPEIIKCCLQTGNYVTVVTNGTVSHQFDKLVSLSKSLQERLFIKFSFQYLELKRLKMLEKFAQNIQKIKNSNCSYTVEITPNDELIPYIDEVKTFSMENFGALPHISIARVDTDPDIPILTKYSKEEYKNIWSTFDSKMFEFKLPLYNEKRKEFCYAGDWSFTVNIGNGDYYQCYKGEKLGNIYQDINTPLKFCAVGKNCPEPHCFNAHSFLLFGDIPNFSTLTYADIRNRICKDGSEWLKPKMKEFFSSKFEESNKEYNLFKKFINKIKNSKRR